MLHDYAQANQHVLKHYFNLDQIAGRKGFPRTVDEIEAAAGASRDNLKIMQSHGLAPVAVSFHQRVKKLIWLRAILG